jgi:hypothetical protein
LASTPLLEDTECTLADEDLGRGASLIMERVYQISADDSRMSLALRTVLGPHEPGLEYRILFIGSAKNRPVTGSSRAQLHLVGNR